MKSIRRRGQRGGEKEVRKCPRGNIGAAWRLCEIRSREPRRPLAGKRKKKEGERERAGGGERMLFRTAKLNYQIKQQRRYINKIDFARRSSKGKRPARRRFASNLVSRNSRFNQVARLKRSLFIFVINLPTYLAASRERGGRQKEKPP